MRKYKVGDVVELRRDLPDRVLDYYSQFEGKVGSTFTVTQVVEPKSAIHGVFTFIVKTVVNGTNKPIFLAVNDIELSYGECLKKILE